MNRIITLLLLVTFAGFLSCNFHNSNKEGEEQNQKISKKPLKVVGYVAGYRNFDFSSIQANKLTHINYAFANIIDGEVRFGSAEQIDETDLKDDDIRALHQLKAMNPDLKILVSVGGWTWSTHFSDVALTQASREKFARSAVAFLKKYRLDGIDLDWEYPNQIGAGNPHRPEDIDNFTHLLAEVRKQLDAQSRADGKSEGDFYLLTIATGGDQAYTNNTKLGEAHPYLDFINIMTYDAYNGLHSISGHHANLYPADGDPAPELKSEEIKSAVTSVLGHIEAGVPVEKINLGLAFYGRIWKGVQAENNGLFQPAETVGMIEYYHRIVTEYTYDKGYEYHWDSSAAAPYLWNADSGIFISFENPASIKLKLEYVKSAGLGGVMFWEYSDDYQSELLDAIDSNK